MAGFIIGAVCLAIAGWQLVRQLRSPDGVEVEATVVEVLEKTSSRTGDFSKLHAPRLSYRHPDTGRTEVFDATTYDGTQRPTVGDRVTIHVDPDSRKVSLPPTTPIRNVVVPAAIGAGFIAAEIFLTSS